MEEMNKFTVDEVIKENLRETTLKNDQAAITLFGDHTHLYINTTGKFIIVDPQAMLGTLGARSALTHLEVGAHKTGPKWRRKRANMVPKGAPGESKSGPKWSVFKAGRPLLKTEGTLDPWGPPWGPIGHPLGVIWGAPGHPRRPKRESFGSRLGLLDTKKASYNFALFVACFWASLWTPFWTSWAPFLCPCPS